ncbi:hypothetical protein KR200_008971 [Drosophila serrata]|nr:hypothetical protein KR200_008971 [Drosophila serrata]
MEKSQSPPEEEDLSIIITQFLSPHQFSYVMLKDVMARASRVLRIEQELVNHCTKEMKERAYLVNQEVIVLYKPGCPPKLMRGVVKKCLGDEYVVWILNYGFTLCCSSLDMWPLPEKLALTFYEVKHGGVANIAPAKDNWSKSCVRVFDKLLKDAKQLNFEVVCHGKANQNLGKLMFKTDSQSEDFQDGAQFLVDQMHASRNIFNDIPEPSDAFSFELAEINDPSIEAGPRVKNIIQLVSSSSNPNSDCTNNNPQPIYNSLSFDITKASKVQMWRGSSESNLSRPSERAPFLEQSVDYRFPLKVPMSAMIMRNKNLAVTVLERTSIENNQNNNEIMPNESSALNTDLESEYEDAQTPVEDDLWKNFQLRKRSSSSSASSEDSFCTVKNASSDDFELSESPEVSLSISERDFSSSATTKNEPTSTTSSKKGESSFVDDKLSRIYNEALQTKHDLFHIAENCSKNVSEAPPSKTMAVLAHSRQMVNPVDSLAHLPFCQEIRRSMNDLNIRSMLPMQLYSWPHIMKGGSVVLINDPGRGRTWSYLPVLCSAVLSSLQNTAYSRAIKLGPLAILLVDSKDRARELTNICISLMSSSDTQMLKVVNSHGYSLNNCQLMLLNSCGILVTTPDHFLDLMNCGISLIDPKRLEFFIFDDFDRVQKATTKGLNEVIKKLNGMPTSPRMQLILVAQQWHEKEFEKLLKDTPKPLAVFGNFLEAAMYGDLRLKFILKESNKKADVLLKFLADQKAFNKRTVIYCKNEIDLTVLDRILTNAGYEWVGPSDAQNQVPHKLLMISDEIETPRLAVRNFEVVIHYSLPNTWSKFTQRFSAMADQIPNYFTTMAQDEKKQPLLSYLLLDRSNSRQFDRLTEFLRAHGYLTDGAPWMNCQPQVDDSIPCCPFFLSTGECDMSCHKRHHFIPADMPENPMQQKGSVIRCKLCKVYDPTHMAVWPLQYQTNGSTEWVDAPYPVNKWLPAIEMSMGTNQNVHHPYRLGDVCAVHHLGYFKRVKIVDIQSRGQVTVQVMDYGTELLHVNARQLLQCPEQKFRAIPSLAMDIRLSGVSVGEGKWLTDTTQWVKQSLSEITDRHQIQITVDFSMLNVVYAAEVALVEKCLKMGTSVYKLLLRKELINRGFDQEDSQSDRQLHIQMGEQKKKANEEVKDNKENIQLDTEKTIYTENTKTFHSSPKSEPKEVSDVFKIRKVNKPEQIMEEVDPVQPKQELTKSDCEPKELLSNENNAPSSPETGLDQLSTSTEALCQALMQELDTMSTPVKQDTHKFLQSILVEIEATNHKKSNELDELKLKDAPQKDSQGPPAKPVSLSLLYSKISKSAVRPRVKWHQTKFHIELTIEQQVPDFELWLVSKTLIYNASSSSPPQQFVLPLLGKVRIVSQKQHGYYLKIKLVKMSILEDWPSLCDSVYTQKYSHWLTYDVERADEPAPPPGLVMWDRYSRHQVNKDDYSSEDEDLLTGVEGSDSGEIFDDC